MSGNNDLLALENLLNEFFSVDATSVRQREIEAVLLSFGSQKGAWNHCLNFLSNSSNQFVSMFCLTTIETVIQRQWQGLSWQERQEIKQSLNTFALQQHRSLPPFIRNKLVKLIVDIARNDWPHFYPEFFTTIIQYIQSDEHTALGLVFARTASEELGSSREDLSSIRREELKRLLLAQVPQLLATLTVLLENLLERQKNKALSTPPPSPTHGQVENALEASASHSGSLISGMWAKLGSTSQDKCKEEDIQTLSLLALQAITQLLSWVPLSNCLTPQLIKVIFEYAAMPQRAQECCVDTPTLGVEAMSAVNELLYKQCVPAEWHSLLLDMFASAFTLLQKILTDGLDTVEETYLKKLAEFLCLFVGGHLHRFESNEKFPLSEFLSLLFRFTFQQPELEGQTECLEMWRQLARYLAVRIQDRAVPREQILNMYREALVSLTAQMLRSFQFRYNQTRLEELDDEHMDDDDQTEWQHFLCQNIETIAKIADLYPLQIYPMVMGAWESVAREYVKLGEHAGGVQEHEGSRLHCSLKDLSSLTQALGRLRAGLEVEPQAAIVVAERLVKLAVFGARNKMYVTSNQSSAIFLQPDLLEVHAQVLAALKAWSPWLGSAPEYRMLALESASAAIISLTNQPPALVAHAAAHLLLSLSASVRCPQLGNLPETQALMQQAPDYASLPDEARRLILRSLENILLLPWPGLHDTSQQWQQRQALYENLISAITADLQGFSVLTADSRVPRIVKCLVLLTDQIENVCDECPTTKRMLAGILGPTLKQTLELFPTYVGIPAACEALLQLFLAVFASLQPQLGAAFAERVARMFLEVFTGERLAQAILQQEAGTGPCVLDKFLKILQLMIQEPSQAFKQFVPSTISVCMDHIFPLVSERQCPDVKLALLELLAQILLHNWKLFFKSSNVANVLLTKENNIPNPMVLQSVEHKDQLLRILRAFGHCLLQPDPAAFRLSLESLEQFNSKYKLYQKVVFRDELLPHFLTVLMNTLIERSHQLLQEEVIGAIHSMASVDFLTFANVFLPAFLSNTSGLDDSQRLSLSSNFKIEQDLPSFGQGLTRLVNDLRCYRLCNSSLPLGSVQL